MKGGNGEIRSYLKMPLLARHIAVEQVARAMNIDRRLYELRDQTDAMMAGLSTSHCNQASRMLPRL